MRTSVQRWLLVMVSAIAGVISVLVTTPSSALFPADSQAGPTDSNPTTTADPSASASATKSEPKTTKTSTKTSTPKPTKTKTEAAPSAVAGDMKDGTFTGGSFSAGSYGTVKVKITVSGGKITKVSTPSLPHNDRESQRINDQAGPYLIGQAIGVTSASDVAGVTGASYTTSAFKKSLQDAINKAKK